MDSMLSAIKARRANTSEGLLNDDITSPEKSKNAAQMKDLVSMLDESQKQMLMSMLSSDQSASGVTAEQLAKGAQSPGEKMGIEAAMMEEDGGMGEMEDSHESEDEIAESMVASSDKMRAGRGEKPRNLAERVRMSLASKLKKKGGE